MKYISKKTRLDVFIMKVEFDKSKLKRLSERYKQAVMNKEDSFIFEDNQYLTDYAKYLIEFLEDKLK